MGQPLAEPATAAGALCFSGASHASWDQDLYRQLWPGGQARQPRVSQGPGRLPERAPQAKTHSHHHRLQQALDHAPAVRHRRQAPQAALPHLGQPRPQFGELAARQFSNQMNSRQSSSGSTAPPRPIRASTVTPCVSTASVPARTAMPASAPSWCTGRTTPAPGICRSLTSWGAAGDARPCQGAVQGHYRHHQGRERHLCPWLRACPRACCEGVTRTGGRRSSDLSFIPGTGVLQDGHFMAMNSKRPAYAGLAHQAGIICAPPAQGGGVAHHVPATLPTSRWVMPERPWLPRITFPSPGGRFHQQH